ncbi:target of Myb1 membrane trafficking protein-like isoform X1 [Conger conger]|uniref:target of Myb1 membrane trafficking protein-like isoform X1 n=1 Tax=Conger conger TaxID=82655 RepID=UPI002A5A0356|nr:target of Myb1 membrane trafficking protein-like isoform X1 [Conger conger]
MDFLIGSPFSTPIGQRIEQATNNTLQVEDWGLNMEICDIINETEEGPKDAVKAIKKKIVGNKNFREVMLALTVLEACVKNCGHRFHVLVSTREFVEGVLVRAILPKNNPPMPLHDKVLSLIQAWADAFRSAPSLTGVVSVYEDLRRRGLEFPMTDLDALSPIHTPHRSVPENEPSVTTTPAPPAPTPAPPQNPVPQPQSTAGPLTLSPEQLQKLRADLDIVRGNLTVMSEMLNQLTPGHAQQSDTELLQQLYTVCRQMQDRVVELIPRLAEEGLIEELLAVNDDLNNNFLRYHRFERLSSTQNVAQQIPSATPANRIDLSPVNQSVATETPAPQPISQSEVRSLSNEKANPNAGGDDDFDMFAQTRGSSLADQRKSVRYEDPGAVEGLAGALDTRLQVTGAIPSSHSTALEDVDKWLSADVEVKSADNEGVTSEEFDKFLEERAKVADHYPSRPDTTSASTRSAPQSARQHERSHDQLFTL